VRIVQGSEAIGHEGHLRLRLGDVDARSEAPKHAVAPIFALA
jgi:hypothetical protein